MFFRVNMRVQNRGEEREIFFVMEMNHENLTQVFDDIVGKGALLGMRLETKACGPNQRRVTDEYETIVMRDSIVSVSELQDDLYDADGELLCGFNLTPPDLSEAGQ